MIIIEGFLQKGHKRHLIFKKITRDILFSRKDIPIDFLL